MLTLSLRSSRFDWESEAKQAQFGGGDCIIISCRAHATKKLKKEVPMPDAAPLDTTDLRESFYRLYREFFDLAEKKRRWSLRDDIPWDQVNRAMDPAIADVVETFCAVELYLPDYMANNLPRFRDKRAWFYANWGYEESKHSLALGDWLLRSGSRSEEQMADRESEVFAHQWHVPHDNALAMVMYGMVQELATWLNYRNLRQRVEEQGDGAGDPALSKLLLLISVDERSHHDFFRKITLMYLERDRQGTLEQLRRVIGSFAMPALHMLAGSQQRVATIQALKIFDSDIYYRDVVRPLLESLGIGWAEFRQRDPQRRSLSAPLVS
jgi:acyl-[acyl-carrier-protein] desaturase